MTNHKHKFEKFSDLIEIISNELSEEFCKKCIEKFENDKRTYDGIVGSGYIPRIKQSTDLTFSDYDDWKEIDDIFYKSLNKNLHKYVEKYDWAQLETVSHRFQDNGYQMQRTLPGEFYTWHSDFSCVNEEKAPRFLTFIWYLNDVFEDGYTEFIDGTRIQPEMGKMIIFPATWTYVHRGYPPKSNAKYIVTGWVHSAASIYLD